MASRAICADEFEKAGAIEAQLDDTGGNDGYEDGCARGKTSVNEPAAFKTDLAGTTAGSVICAVFFDFEFAYAHWLGCVEVAVADQ